MIELKFMIDAYYFLEVSEIKKFNVKVNTYYDETLEKIIKKLYKKYACKSRELGEGRSVINMDYIYTDYLSKNLEGNFSKMINIDVENLRQMKIYQLENWLNISSYTIKLIFYPPGTGACIGFKNGLKFILKLNEKDIHADKPHVHCEYSGEDVRINIKTMELLESNEKFNKQKLAYAKKQIKKNQKGLLKCWNDFTINGMGTNFKMSLDRR